MKEDDYKDLGVRAQGDIIKFREATTKLIKINARQKRNKQLKRQLNIQIQKKEERPVKNIIRWDTVAIDEMDSGSNGDASHESNGEGSNASRKSTTKTGSSCSSERRRLGSIDISVCNLPKRKCSDLPIERKKSNDSALSVDNIENKKETKQIVTSIPPSPNPLNSSSWAVYDKTRPKIKRTMSMVREEECDDPSRSVSFEPEFNAPERKSSSRR